MREGVSATGSAWIVDTQSPPDTCLKTKKNKKLTQRRQKSDNTLLK